MPTRPKLKPLFIALLFLSAFTVHSQTPITGDWQGLSSQQNGNRFSLLLHLEQNGDAITGTMQELSINDPNQYVTLRLTGTKHGDSLQLFDLSVISENSPKNIRWCKKIRRGKVFKTANSIRFEGNWENDGNYVFKRRKLQINPGNPCVPGSFVLYKVIPVDTNIVVLKRDTLAVLPKYISPEEKTLRTAATRKDVIKQRIEVNADSVRLQFYDNGDIDGDTISVIYNNKVVLSHRGLKAQPFEIWLPVKRGSQNKLIMFAENVGTIPPNTALLIFYDGGKQHVVHLDADEGANAVVEIVGKKVER